MSVYRGSFKDRNGKPQRSAVHYVEIRDHAGRRQVVKGFHDKAATRELERKLVKLAALRATDATPDEPMRRWVEGLAPALRDRLAEIGLVTPTQVAGLRPLSDLRDSWERHLRAEGRSDHYVKNATAAAKRVLDGIGATYWSDIDATKVQEFLSSERATDSKAIGARSSNFLLGATRGFCRWCVRTGLASEDPLRILRPLNVAEDRRRERRALTGEELAKLLDAAERGPDFDGMSGPTRAVLYRVATETGLRRGELLSLVVADLDLDDEERSSVRVKAAHAKNGRDARLPLKPTTARALAGLVERSTPLARVFPVSTHWRAFDAIQADLKAAEVPYRDDAGRVADFHALRTTFGTNLARSGVSLQMAQRLMRHSDPRLTSNVYTVLGADDERAAIESLPDVATRAPAASVAATGTDGRPAGHPVLRASMREVAGKRGETQDGSGLVGAGVGGRGSEEPGPFQASGVWRTPRDSNPQPADPKSAAGESATARLAGQHAGDAPEDARFEALRATWSRLDEAARETVLRVAEGLARK